MRSEYGSFFDKRAVHPRTGHTTSLGGGDGWLKGLEDRNVALGIGSRATVFLKSKMVGKRENRGINHRTIALEQYEPEPNLTKTIRV
jgi:hypothetical protein